ncbi:3-deoxy-7-phosphoheptulonate synthase [Streptomyces sp. NPDC016626]|uniref:3-deoxy-7-phosphoheptulonate synthase n=1 Tax=Streptomyces sp. NPDC016626 TaxID=3364968 RepID=UPI0036FC1108
MTSASQFSEPQAAARPAEQQPQWPDPQEVIRVRERLAASPPLVGPEDSDRLTALLGEVARGRAFLLQGGDCAEMVERATPAAVHGTVETLERLAGTLERAFGMPVVTVGRLAGQYAKPRSSPVETLHGRTLPAYRGDAVNGAAFTPRSRTPDPRRMLRAYEAAATTLRLVADRPGPAPRPAAREVFVSHEALLMDYELPLTREDPRTGRPYAGSGHLLWAGERTRDPRGAHIAHLARIGNPVAVKIGPGARPDDLLRLARLLNPAAVPGRLTFIVRTGAGTVRRILPDLVGAVAGAGVPVAWVCDPMHGNTVRVNGRKTRYFDDVYEEISGFFEVHRALGTHPGGVHLEMTGADVTECLGGGSGAVWSAGIRPADLPTRYESACDPRLNRTQTLELGRLIAGLRTAPLVTAG